MSSILKALEKAEESSSPKRLAADAGVIRTNRQRASWVMPTAVLCGGVVAAFITYAAMGGLSRPKAAAPTPVVAKNAAPPAAVPSIPMVDPVPVTEQAAPAAQAPATGQQAAPAPEAAAAASLPAAPPAAAAPAKDAPGTAAVIAPRMNTRAFVPTKKTAPAAAAPVPSAPPQARSVVAAPLAAPAAAKAAPVVEAKPAAAARAQLKVSGIAYQDNGGASFAVVNGRAVLQGGSVDGYRVVEIRHDAVRFSGGNGSFDVPLEVEDK